MVRIQLMRFFFTSNAYLFLQNGNYHNIAVAYTSAEVLNPISAATMLVVEITDAMKDLGSHFGLEEFHEGHDIIDDMILEIGTYKRIATSANDAFWNTLDGSSTYDEKLVSRIAKGKIANNVTWKDDPIETAGVYGSSGGGTERMWQYSTLQKQLV